MDSHFIGRRITELRLISGVSEYQMSLELGKSKSYIQSITSNRSLPSVPQLLEICDYFDMTPAEFFDEKNHDSPLFRSTVDKLRKLEDKDLQLICEFADRIFRVSEDKEK